jgi:hypothetical protein
MQFGILLKKLGVTQQSYHLTRSVNALVDQDNRYSVTVFHEDWDLLLAVPHFTLMQAIELYGYPFKTMATDLKSAEFLLRCPAPIKKYFYVWDVEWMRGHYDFEQLSYVYQNPKLELIARTDSHAKIIENCWKTPKFIMNDFDTNVLKEIINEN